MELFYKNKWIKGLFLALIFTYSYAILQEFFVYIIYFVLDIIKPELGLLLESKIFLLDTILTFPLMFIYGYFYMKYFLKDKEQICESVEILYDGSVEVEEQVLHSFNLVGSLKDGIENMVKRTSFLDLIKCFAIAIFAYNFSGLWFLFLEKYLLVFDFWANSYKEFNEIWSTVAEGDYFWMIFSSVFLGPIVEELLFRGIILNYLLRTKVILFSVLFSGLLFGIFHGQPVQVVYTAFMGVFLAMTYVRTKRFEIPLLIHIFNNGLSELLNLIPENLEIFSNSLMFLVSFLGFYYIFKAYKSGKL